MAKFKNGQVLVALKNAVASCGRIRIHKGSIVKISDNEPDIDGDIRVYRNKARENISSSNFAPEHIFREATKDEIKAYNSGIKNVDFI